MSTIAIERAEPHTADAGSGMSTVQVWGLLLIAPYVLVFLVFVLYPVLYGFWLARAPDEL